MTYHRTMGLSVPVTEILDPVAWRERYASGIVLGQGATPSERSVLDDLLGCGQAGGAALTSVGQAAAAAVDEAVDELKDDVIRWHLKAALSELEMKLGIPMGIVICKADPVDDGLTIGLHYDKVVPRAPFLRSEQMDFYRIDLPAGTISVERIRAYWFGQNVWEISSDMGNTDLIRLEHPNTASLHIMPMQSTSLLVAMPGLGSLGYGPLQLIKSYPGILPDTWAVDYTMGPKSKYGGVGTIEAALAHWCYCKAGMILFSMAGQAIGRGISNSSLSIDGLSKSVGLNAQQGLNAALETRLKEATDAIDWQAMKLYKKGMRVRSYS